MVIVAHIAVNVTYLLGNLTFTVVLVPDFEGFDQWDGLPPWEIGVT